jgi:hypothetical protein
MRVRGLGIQNLPGSPIGRQARSVSMLGFRHRGPENGLWILFWLLALVVQYCRDGLCGVFD